MPSLGQEFLAATIAEYRSYKKTAEKALGQVGDEQLHARLDPESNSLAVIVQHVANNLRSRFTDFLTSDGEKPDRRRDAEFEDQLLTRQELMARWEQGWSCLFGALQALSEDDLVRTVTVRGEPQGVVTAIQRSLAHLASHVGQVVFLAKHLAADHWQPLSIPRGQSEQWNARMRERFQKRRT